MPQSCPNGQNSCTDPVAELLEAAVGHLAACPLKLDVPPSHVQEPRPDHVRLPGAEQLKQPAEPRLRVSLTAPGRHGQHRESDDHTEDCIRYKHIDM